MSGRIAEERRARLWESVTLGDEEQRRAIARELHDQAGSSLASTLVRCRLIERSKTLDEARRHVDQLASEISLVMDSLARLSRRLHPVSIEELGLGVALERLAVGTGEQHQLTVETLIDLPSPPAKLTSLALYRMVQELLRNVTKHAQATRVSVTAEQSPRLLRFVVHDDGIGFDPAQLDELLQEGRVGLATIQERAALLGGETIITSQPGSGTRIELRVPHPLFERGDAVDPTEP